MNIVSSSSLFLLVLPSTALGWQLATPKQTALPQTQHIQAAPSHAIAELARPTEAFASVLQTYHASLPAVTEVVKPADPKLSAAARIGAEKQAVSESAKATIVAEKYYKAERVNASLGALKTDLLSKIPAQDEPLRRYVEARFPRPSSKVDGYVSEAELKAVNDQAEGMVMEFLSMESFSLDLKVKSVPSHATFSYAAEYQQQAEELSVTTDNTVPLWRGPYVCTVKMQGYWPVTTKVNMIAQKGDTFECVLVSKEGTTAGGECSLR